MRLGTLLGGRSLDRFRKGITDERGMALVMAIGVMATLAITGGSLVLLSTSNERTANRSLAQQKVTSAAQSGIDNAVAVLGAQTTTGVKSPTVFSNLSVANRSATINGVSVTWNGTLVDTPVGSLHNYKWQLTATGTMVSPAGGNPVSKSITADVPLVPKTTQAMSGSAWNYVYSWQPTGCGGTANNSSLRTNMYFVNDFCMDGNSDLAGPVQLIVHGKTTMDHPQNKIGASGSPISSNYMKLGCTSRSNGTLHTPCNSGDKVYPNSVSSGVPVIARPVATFADWYTVSSPGPTSPCGTGSTGTLPVFDNNTTRDGSLSVTNLTPGAAYDCITPKGRLKWVPGSPGTLTISGTVFFDGPGQMSGSANYDGQGAIYFNGAWTMWQNNLCAVYTGSNCNLTSGAWTGAPDILVVVANGASSFGQSTYQGAFYSEGAVTISNSAQVQGPMVATVINLENNTGTNIFPLNMAVPFGTPTPTNDITEWTLTPPTNYSG